MKRVITYGTFDLFHEGHRRILKRAKALGDYLIVGVTTEQYDMQRGKMNVFDSLIKRVGNVWNSGFVDEVIIEDHAGQKIEDIQKYNIDIFVIGSDWIGKFDYLKEYCKVLYLERTKNISSTAVRLKVNGVIKIGLIGSGELANYIMHDLKYICRGTIVALYNSDLLNSSKILKTFRRCKVFNDYGQFLREIDAVIIASPYNTHYKYSRAALLANKHVLCFKPLGFSGKEVCELFNIARQKNLVLMEGLEVAYMPGFSSLLTAVKTGQIGAVKDIDVSCIPNPSMEIDGENDYSYLVNGNFLKLASCALLPIIKILGENYKKLHFESLVDKNNTDIYTKVYFKYEEALATIKIGNGVESDGKLLISGTNGYITVSYPWWHMKKFEVCYEDSKREQTFSYPFYDYGRCITITDFLYSINKSNTKNYKLSQNDSIALAGTIEKFLRWKCRGI